MHLFSDIGSLGDYLLGLELLVLFCLVGCVLAFRRSASFWTVLCFLVVGALLFSHLSSYGRPILGVTLAAPGSWITRFLQFAAPLWLRRFVEPSLWLLFLAFAGTALQATIQRARTLFSVAAVALVFVIFIEGWWLTQLSRTILQGHAAAVPIGILVQSFLLQISLLSASLGLWHSLRSSRSDLQPRRMPLLRIAATAIVLLLICAASNSGQMTPLAGAHYYSWFPENWKAGYSLRKVLPKIEPMLGEYLSDDPAIFKQHVKWAKQHGLDFFVFDWWPQRTEVDRRIYENLQREKDLGGLSYALMYESLDIKQPGDTPPVTQPADAVYLDEIRSSRLQKHWEYLAKRYMTDPRYLRIDGKAVLFVYATRHLVGPVAEVMQAAKRHVERTTGVRLYLVGDEVFFNALALDKNKQVRLLEEYSPSWRRLAAFDALTAYNPYDAARTQFAGSRGVENWLSEVERLFAHYRKIAATAAIPFFPGVLPGYNDRGVRLAAGHYVIPRKFGELGKPAEQSLFHHALTRHVRPFLTKDASLFIITSWNEWNEGTQIEPTIYSPPTKRDKSDWGTNYTDGEWHEGYEFLHLRELRAFVDGKSPDSNSFHHPVESSK